MLNKENKITVYSLETKRIANEVKPNFKIIKFFPNLNGTKAVCIDKSGAGYLVNFLNERSVKISGFSERIRKVLWDMYDPNLFIGVEINQVICFIYNRNYYKGETCSAVKEILSMEDVEKTQDVASSRIEKDNEAVMVAEGFIMLLNGNNNLNGFWLGSHSSFASFTGKLDEEDNNLRYFFQNLALNKLTECLAYCHTVGDEEKELGYETLAETALKNLNLTVAKKAYQLAGNISMVHSLDHLEFIEEKNVVQGMVAMVLCDYTLAQEKFLQCTNPSLALDLRCDIQDWALALDLAEQLNKDKLPEIRRNLAQATEKQEKYQKALKLFETSQIEEKGTEKEIEKIKEHNVLCAAGIARTSIKTGNITRGYGLATQIKDKELLGEIAACCEKMKNFEEAASLYEDAEMYERAATLYIAQKKFKKAENLIKKLTSPKILSSLAKMKETGGNYRDAELAYERAKDWENVIRVNLEKMDNYDKALRLYKEKSPTQPCAQLLADYCDRVGKRKESIEFLVQAGKQTQAFNKAQVYQEMESYAESLEEISEEEALKIAQYFEGVSNYHNAGKYYEQAGQHNNSLACYFQAGEEYLDYAIDMVANSQSELLFNKMLDFLEGDEDNDPKDTKYAFKLYLKFGKIDEASMLVIAIVDKEMEDGNYKDSHQILFQLLSEIIERKVKVTYELMQKMIIVHSYIIVKRLIKMGEHEPAAKMLNRVCDNISQFPRHATNILTTAIIESSKAGLKATAFKWAAMICSPDYRKSINPKFKKKIENLARKPVKTEKKEQLSPCPFCNTHYSEYTLVCPTCFSNVPFCIASGKHLTTQNICTCVHCGYAAFEEYLVKMLEIDPKCPMCNKEMHPNEINTDVDDPKELIRSLVIQNNTPGDDKKKKKKLGPKEIDEEDF